MSENNVSEKVLKKVYGGAGDGRTIIIALLLPSTGKETNEVTVYIDGVLESSLCNNYDSSVESINLKFAGTRGIKRVDIKVNKISYKTYEVNFDSGSYIEL